MWWLVLVLAVFIIGLDRYINRTITLRSDNNTVSSTISTDVIKDDKGGANKKETSFEEQKKKKEIAARKNYIKRESLWGSNAEKSIYKAIRDMNNEAIIVLPHVSLNEIFEAKPDKVYEESRKKYIKYYHVDFLVCEKEHLVPLLGIEVDGKYHKNTEQQLSDVFKDELFKNNSLPLMRIKCDEYELDEVVSEIKSILHKTPVYCGKCGAKMVLKDGVAGKDDFYGCSSYSTTKCTYKRAKDFKYVS